MMIVFIAEVTTLKRIDEKRNPTKNPTLQQDSRETEACQHRRETNNKQEVNCDADLQKAVRRRIVQANPGQGAILIGTANKPDESGQ